MANIYEKALKFAFEAKEKRNKKMKKAGTFMAALFPYDEFYFDFGRRTGKTTFLKNLAITNKDKSIVILVRYPDYLRAFDEVLDYAKVYTTDDIKVKVSGIEKIDLLLIDDASDIENLKEVIESISSKLTSESVVIKVG